MARSGRSVRMSLGAPELQLCGVTRASRLWGHERRWAHHEDDFLDPSPREAWSANFNESGSGLSRKPSTHAAMGDGQPLTDSLLTGAVLADGTTPDLAILAVAL